MALPLPAKLPAAGDNAAAQDVPMVLMLASRSFSSLV
jgi:hypothetical protein